MTVKRVAQNHEFQEYRDSGQHSSEMSASNKKKGNNKGGHRS